MFHLRSITLKISLLFVFTCFILNDTGWKVLEMEDELPCGRTQSIAVVTRGGADAAGGAAVSAQAELMWLGGFEYTTNNRVLGESKVYLLKPGMMHACMGCVCASQMRSAANCICFNLI